ncbi:alpha/beta fold hydrolase [Sphingomonas sp. MMS24-JH45]
MVHGFPESWYSWRHQIGPVAAAGFTACVIDVRGYGGSDKPQDVAAYDMELIVGDVVGVANALSPGAPAILLGHDWARRSCGIRRSPVRTASARWRRCRCRSWGCPSGPSPMCSGRRSPPRAASSTRNISSSRAWPRPSWKRTCVVSCESPSTPSAAMRPWDRGRRSRTGRSCLMAWLDPAALPGLAERGGTLIIMLRSSRVGAARTAQSLSQPRARLRMGASIRRPPHRAAGAVRRRDEGPRLDAVRGDQRSRGGDGALRVQSWRAICWTGAGIGRSRSGPKRSIGCCSTGSGGLRLRSVTPDLIGSRATGDGVCGPGCRVEPGMTDRGFPLRPRMRMARRRP